jgi:hypothetical protein
MPGEVVVVVKSSFLRQNVKDFAQKRRTDYLFKSWTLDVSGGPSKVA